MYFKQYFMYDNFKMENFKSHVTLTFYKIHALFTNFELNLVSSLKNFVTLLLVLLDMLLTLGDGTEQGEEVIKPLKMFLPKDKPQHNSLLY